MMAAIETRRRFLVQSSAGLAALATLLQSDTASEPPGLPRRSSGEPPSLPRRSFGEPHFAPKAKRVIYLFQSGAPSQIDLFDHKPRFGEMRGNELPESVRNGHRLTGIPSRQ